MLVQLWSLVPSSTLVLGFQRLVKYDGSTGATTRKAIREDLSSLVCGLMSLYQMLGLPSQVQKLPIHLACIVWRKCYDVCVAETEIYNVNDPQNVYSFYIQIYVYMFTLVYRYDIYLYDRHIYMYTDIVDSCHFISSHAISPHVIHLISSHFIIILSYRHFI